MNELQFDIVLHLAGEQVLPNYMGIKLCEASRHLVVATEATASLLPRIERELRRQGREDRFMAVRVPAYDYEGIHRTFATAAGRMEGVRVGFNVTGGTKPMFAAALDFCRENGAVPFYIDTAERLVRFLVAPYKTLPMPPVFAEVSEFVHLTGQEVLNEGCLPDAPAESERVDLARLMWKHRNLVRRWMQGFAKSTDRKYMNSKTPVPQYVETLTAMREGVAEKFPKVIKAWDEAFPTEVDWRKAAVFAAGGWLEEYALHRLAPLLDDGTLKDLRMGFMPSWEDRRLGASPFSASQEFDLCFTDGYTLTILECKAGTIKQEHIQKLENLRRAFGGSFGRAALISANKLDAQTLKRLESLRAISAFVDTGIDLLPLCAVDFAPGKIFSL